MTNRGMFVRILVKSLTNRRTRIAAATLAVVLGISLVSALAAISMDARGKAGRELRDYGANILLSAKATETQIGAGGMSFGTLAESSYLEDASLGILASEEFKAIVLGYVPYLYGVVEVNQQKAVLAGISFDQIDKVSPWWQITGRWIENREDDVVIIGKNVAKKLGYETGQSLTLQYGERYTTLRIVGIVETGAAEDSQIFVNMGVAQRLLDKTGLISMVQVSALPDKQPLSTTAAELQKKSPATKITIIGQIAEAESAVVGRVELLLFIVSALVLLASALTVASTMMTAVLERTKEVGLMKALGASEKGVAFIFLGEAVVIGCLGGILGFIIGAIIANIAGQSVFGTAVAINPWVLPLSIAIALAVSFFASLLPINQASGIDPAITLRGE